MDAANKDFDTVIRLRPKQQAAYGLRAEFFYLTGRLNDSLADFSRAISIDPNYASAYFGRSYIWHAKGEYDKALADLTQAVRLNPKAADARLARAHILNTLGKHDRAISDLADGLINNPNDVALLEVLAWTLATCPQAKYRDGKQAVKHARRACELTKWKDWVCLDTFAAASAEAGDFAQAVKWEVEAIKLVPDEEKIKKQEMRARLDLFKADKPYHENPTTKAGK